MNIDVRDAHVYGGIVLGGIGAQFGWLGLAVAGLALFYLGIRRP